MAGVRLHGAARGGILLKKSDFANILEASTDTDWAQCPNTRRSMTCVLVRVFGMPMLLSSRKQKTVALSSTMAETIGMSEGGKRIVAARRACASLGIELPPTPFFIDNQAAMAIAENSHKITELGRHIAVRHLYIQELVRRRMVKLEWVPSAENLADIGTKALDAVKHGCIVHRIFSYL